MLTSEKQISSLVIVIKHSYETSQNETKHLWGFAVARKSHCSSNQTAECFSQNIRDTWLRLTYDLAPDLLLSSSEKEATLCANMNCFSRRAEFCEVTRAVWVSKCVSCCGHSFGAVLPQVRQAAIKWTLCVVCLAIRCGLPINGFRKLS